MTNEEIIKMTREADMELYGLGKNRARFVYHLEAFAKLVAAKATAELESQEPVAWLDPWTRNNVTTDYEAYGNNGIPLYTTPPQRTEQNFCPRCGKRTKDIHTCTPPKENT